MSDYLFVGSLCLDNIYTVQWYPSEDSDTRCESKRVSVGGNATNSAVVFRQLLTKYEPKEKGKVFLHSAISDDLLSEKALSELKGLDIGITSSSFTSGHTLGESMCILAAKSGTRTIIHDPGTVPELGFQELPDLDWKRIKYCHFEGRNPTKNFNGISKVYAFIESVLEKREKENLNFFVSLEVEKSPERHVGVDQLLQLKTDLTIIGKDFTTGVGVFSSGKNFLHEWIPKIAAKYMVVTWGMDGSFGLDNTSGKEPKDIIHVPAFGTEETSEAVDSLAAGDTYCAALSYKLMKKSKLEDSMKFAAKIAALKCQQTGLTDLPLPDI